METPSSQAHASSRGVAVVLPPGVSPLEPDDPAQIGGNALVGRLGEGGMGVVYLATGPCGGLVAVKAAHTGTTEGDEVHRRFRAEAASLRRVPASCTLRLLADGTVHAPPHIVTEYVEGRSLEDVVEREGPLPPEQLRALATGVARALAAVHWTGLVHRDLKPANVLLTPTGPRVIDFGIAQEVPAAGGPTASGVVVGSPGWIAPERLSRCPATSAADVFGWGCLVAYAGTGRNPFGEGDGDAVALSTLHERPDLDGLDESLRGTVADALAKDPARRPTAAELLPLLGGGTSFARRRHTALLPTVAAKRTLAVAATAVALVAGFAVLALTGAQRTPAREPQGGRQAEAPAVGSTSGSLRATAPRARPSDTGRGTPRAWPAAHRMPSLPELPMNERGPGHYRWPAPGHGLDHGDGTGGNKH